VLVRKPKLLPRSHCTLHHRDPRFGAQDFEDFRHAGLAGVSPRLLPLRLEHGAGSRRGEELDQRLCRRRVLRAPADAGMEGGVVLQLGRQGPEDFYAGRGHQFVDEDDAELDFACGDEFPHDRARGGEDGLGLDLSGDSDALEQAREVDAAVAFFRPGDRFRGEKRPLERVRGADVGTRRAFLDAGAHARARDLSARGRVHLSLLREVVDPGAGEDGEVEGFAAFDLALHEGGRELFQRSPDAVRGEDLDFGGGNRSHGEQGGDPDCGERFDVHVVPPA